VKRPASLKADELRALAKSMRDVAKRSRKEGHLQQAERFERKAEDYEAKAKKALALATAHPPETVGAAGHRRLRRVLDGLGTRRSAQRDNLIRFRVSAVYGSPPFCRPSSSQRTQRGVRVDLALAS